MVIICGTESFTNKAELQETKRKQFAETASELLTDGAGLKSQHLRAPGQRPAGPDPPKLIPLEISDFLIALVNP